MNEVNGGDAGCSGDSGVAPRAFFPFLLAVVWVLVFAAGVVVETTASRFYLAPLGTLSGPGEKPGVFDSGTLAAVSVAVTGSVPKGVSPGSGSESIDADATLRSLLAAAARREPNVKFSDFLVCVTCYSPINIALLALVAGGMGGCMSKIASASRPGAAKASVDALSLQAMEQSPWLSAVEGLVAYVCVVAGLYVLVDDPFKNPSPASYTKLAGLISAVAFAVGYDRTRFTGLLNTIPVPRGQALPAGGSKSSAPDGQPGKAG